MSWDICRNHHVVHTCPSKFEKEGEEDPILHKLKSIHRHWKSMASRGKFWTLSSNNVNGVLIQATMIKVCNSRYVNYISWCVKNSNMWYQSTSCLFRIHLNMKNCMFECNTLTRRLCSCIRIPRIVFESTSAIFFFKSIWHFLLFLIPKYHLIRYHCQDMIL
jgi:hypothetical protein